MRDVVYGLVKKYFEIRMILKRTILTERKGRITINVYDDVAPNLWNMFEQGTVNINTGLGKLDFNKVKEIQEEERLRIARQVFQITLAVLQEKNREGFDAKRQWDVKYGRISPSAVSSGHVELISYSLGALFDVGVLTPSEFDITEPAFDETGKLLYVKQLPKLRTDEITDALGGIIGRDEER